MNPKIRFTQFATVVTMCIFLMPGGAAQSQSEAVPGDELGMGRELGAATWARCAEHLSSPGAKAYELSHVRSNTMPLSPFAGPFEITYLPTAGFPETAQTYNVDVLNEEILSNVVDGRGQAAFS